MSSTLLLSTDVPKYIREIVKNLRLDTNYDKGDVPGYTFRLYGKHKVGHESQLHSDCEKLLFWCKKYYADAYIVGNHFWHTDVEAPSGVKFDKAHQAKAYRENFHNYIKLVITDPVALRFEKDGYYREKEPLSKQIDSADNKANVFNNSVPNKSLNNVDLNIE